MEKLDAVIVDIDGTIAHMGSKEPPDRRPYDWDRVGEDEPIIPIINLVSMFRTMGFVIIFVSGRDACCREATVKWLMTEGVSMDVGKEWALVDEDQLFMRPKGNNEPDVIVKRKIYTDIIAPNYDVHYVLDDRNTVVKMWRDMGLTVLQVADGDF